MRFTESLWRDIAGLRAAIGALPLNRELAQGALSDERFRHYMLQDALYLEGYSRALSVASAKAPDAAAMVAFAEAARDAIVVERALHESFFRKYGIAEREAADTEPNPTCLAYTSFLIATAYQEPYEVLVAALLPCFWIYWDTGSRIARDAAPDNPYQDWIDTYADEEFARATRRVIALTDEAAAGATEARRARMARAFRRSSRFEWMFWDAAYRLEAWPVEG